MAVTNGTKVLYRNEHGDHVGFVNGYQAGRDAGDHFVSGFCNAEWRDAGGGDTFSTWSVKRDSAENGTFRVA